MELSRQMWLLRAIVQPTPRDSGEDGDRVLIERFVRDRDEVAFEGLVRRHGPMVLGVCRRTLRDSHTAEDAFQATFLILARQARAIRQRECVGGWLHRVAVRVAGRLRMAQTRRKEREKEAAAMPARSNSESDESLAWDELRPLLDAALDELPAKYRTAVVLCYLEGKTHQQAAREIGCPAGSVWWVLARALTLLRRRLSNQGVTLSAGLLTWLLTAHGAQATVPVRLLQMAIRGGVEFAAGQAVSGVSTRALTLAEGVMKTMTAGKLKGLVGLVLLLGLMTGGVAAFATPPFGPPPPPKFETPRQQQEKPPLLKGEAVTDKATGKAPDNLKVRELPGHERGTICLTVAPDGRTIATAGHDSTVRLWDLRTGKETRRFGLTGQPGMVLFTRDLSAIFVGGAGVLPAEWDFETLKPGPVYYSQPHLYSALAVAPDGKWGAAGWDRTIEVFERGTSKVITRFPAHTGAVGNLAFSPDGRILASTGPGGKAGLWEPASGRSLGTLPGHAPWALAFGPGGHVLATTASGNEVVLTEIITQAARRKLLAPQGTEIAAVAVSPDGRLVAAGADGGAIHLWDAATGKHLRKLERHKTLVESLAFADGGKVLLSAARGESIVFLWDMPALAPLREVKLTPANLENAWGVLAGTDAAKAYEAMLALAGTPRQAVAFLRDRPREGAADTARINRWIKDLDSDRFALRRAAEAELEKHIEAALPLLRKALENAPSLEARKAMERLIGQLDRPTESPLTRRAFRTIEILEWIASKEAREALKTLAVGQDKTRVGQAAKDALGRLGK